MICIAVIGAGHWGPNLIRNFHSGITSRVKYVVDNRPQRLDALKSARKPQAFDRKAALKDWELVVSA